MQIDKGTLIFGIIIAILITHFLGFIVFLWCIPVVIAIIIIAVFYKIFVSEGWVPDLSKLPKKIWKKYLKWERKLFNWMDKNF